MLNLSKNQKILKKKKPITRASALDFMACPKNRKKFYRALWEYWGKDCGYKLLKTYRKSGLVIPHRGYMTAAQIHKIQLAFGSLGWELSPKGAIATHKKYAPRIQKAMLGFAKDAGGRWPTLGITDTIKELVLRGWVHKAEAINIKPTEYSVYCHYADLVYDKSWYSQDGALKFLIEGGIPGRTGVRSPYKR